MLKRFFQFFLSVKLASLLLLVFAAVIGVATFIENDFGRVTAKALIYSKWWFELILFMLLINLIYNLKRYNLFRKEKLAVLTFHLAFIIILIGSAITRYHSFEGMMHIREGEESNIIILSGDSAWSPVIQLVQKLAKFYKLEQAYIEYEESGADFGGSCTINSEGITIEEESYTYRVWCWKQGSLEL